MLFIVGDPVVLRNTWTVAGVNTDPSTVSLAVTTPAGVTTTYTYGAAEITRTAAGSYTKTITATAAGTWRYVWTGTGSAADVADGLFSVRDSLALPLTSVLTMDEARTAANLPSAISAEKLGELVSYTIAVTEAMESYIGPVVKRLVLNEYHPAPGSSVLLRRYPVASVTSVYEYADTQPTTLTAWVPGNPTTATDYTFDPTLGAIRRGIYGGPFLGGVMVNYIAGRFDTTTAVEQRYKVAAAGMLGHLWRREEVASPQQVAAFQRSWGLPVPRPILEVLPDQVLPKVAG